MHIHLTDHCQKVEEGFSYSCLGRMKTRVPQRSAHEAALSIFTFLHVKSLRFAQKFPLIAKTFSRFLQSHLFASQKHSESKKEWNCAVELSNVSQYCKLYYPRAHV